MFAVAVVFVCAKQVHIALAAVLVEMVVGDGCHASFVLLAHAVYVEIAEADNLGGQTLRDAPADHLVKQKFGIAVNVERLFQRALFAERCAFAVNRRAAGV